MYIYTNIYRLTLKQKGGTPATSSADIYKLVNPMYIVIFICMCIYPSIYLSIYLFINIYTYAYVYIIGLTRSSRRTQEEGTPAISSAYACIHTRTHMYLYINVYVHANLYIYIG